MRRSTELNFGVYWSSPPLSLSVERSSYFLVSIFLQGFFCGYFLVSIDTQPRVLQHVASSYTSRYSTVMPLSFTPWDRPTKDSGKPEMLRKSSKSRRHILARRSSRLMRKNSSHLHHCTCWQNHTISSLCISLHIIVVSYILTAPWTSRRQGEKMEGRRSPQEANTASQQDAEIPWTSRVELQQVCLNCHRAARNLHRGYQWSD
jgi:hypothetical protein